jgi:hypothetical protein
MSVKRFDSPPELSFRERLDSVVVDPGSGAVVRIPHGRSKEQRQTAVIEKILRHCGL